jgi:hypothetical protein
VNPRLLHQLPLGGCIDTVVPPIKLVIALEVAVNVLLDVVVHQRGSQWKVERIKDAESCGYIFIVPTCDKQVK